MGKFDNMTFENFLVEAPEPLLIKDLRIDLGLTASQAAKLAGLSDGSLWTKYENGNRQPNKRHRYTEREIRNWESKSKRIN